MKKIIHIISTLSSGGSEGVLFKLITTNKNNKHYVISLSKGGFYSHKLKKSKIKIYHLDFTNIKNTFFSIYKIKKIFDKIKPDIIQTWLYHADLIGGLVGHGEWESGDAWKTLQDTQSPSRHRFWEPFWRGFFRSQNRT